VNWRAEHSPRVLMTPGESRSGLIPRFSFLPQGVRLGYEEALRLPSEASELRRAIAAHLRPLGADLPPTLVLKAYGFLLATAPLSSSTRAVTYDDMASLAGVRACGRRANVEKRDRDALCAAAEGREIEVTIAAHTREVLAVEQRITAESPLFPGLRAGTVVESDTFSST
jgi:hypothetical protein